MQRKIFSLPIWRGDIIVLTYKLVILSERSESKDLRINIMLKDIESLE